MYIVRFVPLLSAEYFKVILDIQQYSINTTLECNIIYFQPDNNNFWPDRIILARDEVEGQDDSGGPKIIVEGLKINYIARFKVVLILLLLLRRVNSLKNEKYNKRK